MFTKRPGALTNDFFVNLLDMGRSGSRVGAEDVFEGRDRKTGDAEVDRDARRPGLRLELAAARARGGLRVRGRARRSSSQDFVAAWAKVMNLDRFDKR